MSEYHIRLTSPRPYFAELPYYVWGRVNYDSDGDCKAPRDRNWTWMELTNRETDERLEISSNGDDWTVAGPASAAAKVAYFLHTRSGADSQPPPIPSDWDHSEAMARTSPVVAAFNDERLLPFANGHVFWGSWKWIGWFATDFTWYGRWIMDSVTRQDARAVTLCIDDLRHGTFAERSVALRHALSLLTGLFFATDPEWVDWYDNRGGAIQYPEPDFDKWFEDLKRLYGE